jgi:hypothetical protein
MRDRLIARLRAHLRRKPADRQAWHLLDKLTIPESAEGVVRLDALFRNRFPAEEIRDLAFRPHPTFSMLKRT